MPRAMPPKAVPADSTTVVNPETADVTSSDVCGFVCGDTVVAARDLRVRGKVVVRQGGSGYVVGPASSGRICVQFEQRGDQSDNRLNCLPDELRHTLAGGYLAGTRVRCNKALDAPSRVVIPAGTSGVVVGPARDSQFQRLLVRFALHGHEHVEEVACDPVDIETNIPGNFRRGNAIVATRDLRVGGQVVVREGVLGTVVGPSTSDSQHRVTVSFSHREDGSRNRLNCVVNEIKLYLAGGLEVGARVQAVRPISYDGFAPVPTGSVGTVVGPAIDEPLARIVVRWDSASPTGTPPEREAHSDDVRLMIAGGFRRGETVLAAKDLRVKGIVVVKQNVLGTVVGQSSTDPAGRVTVAFARREDGRSNNLNVVPAEIQHMPCTGGLVPGDRVAALRQLLVVPKGAQGVVVGPSCSQSSRVAVRFSSQESSGDKEGGEDVVLHVEPEDLKVLSAVAEDVDDALQPDKEDDTEDPGPALAGGYYRGDAVAATRDLRVGGKVVVRANILGTVIGPSGQDLSRITVAFAWREDGKSNNLNVISSEIRRVDSTSAEKGEICAICLAELDEDREEDICRMPCGHLLHKTCVTAYLNHQTHTMSGTTPTAPPMAPQSSGCVTVVPLKPAQCPVCRKEMLP